MTSRAATHRSLPYRPAIDGLRAFAILSVVVYHLHSSALPGGWFGVDVFFVISGFLITALLLSEYRSSHGHIDLVGFWMARARRLLPALFVVLLAVLATATFLTVPGRTRHVAGDVLATLGYVANWRFVLGDEAYFGQVASPSPLRHAWSLAVEEQFYLVYPLLLLGLLSLIRLRRGLVAALLAIAAGSALLMSVLHHPGLDPSRVYYGTDTRAHQLLIGAAAAAFISGGPGAIDRGVIRAVDRWCRRLAPVAMLVVISTFWWAGRGESALLEGLAVPVSVVITIVLVAATSPSSSLTQRVLSWEPLRLTGMLSYGLYLWHWPIIVFLNDQVLTVPAPARIAIQVALTVLLATLSYRYVERPVRRHGIRALLPRTPRISAAVCWATVPALLVGALVMPQAARAVAPMVSGSDSVTVPEAGYRTSDEVIRVRLIGNSVPESLIVNAHPSEQPDLDLIDTTHIGCDPLPAPKLINGYVQPENPGCPRWRGTWQGEGEPSDADVVLYFVAHTLVTDRQVDGKVVAVGTPAWEAMLRDSLDKTLAAAGDSKFAVVNLACHAMPTFNNEELERVNSFRYVHIVNRTVTAWARANDVPVIDEYSLLCAGDKMHDTINGVPLYEDSLHFTSESAPIFWRWLAPQVQRIARGQDPS